ncbi:MAG: SDR family NAD-dependent epimerase/dehydratase, partial [Flavobacteriales bacterium]
EEIMALTGTDQKVVYRDLPENDPKQRRPDISRAKEVLDWTPKIDRAEGLKRTYAYFKTLTQEELHKSEHKDFEAFTKL